MSSGRKLKLSNESIAKALAGHYYMKASGETGSVKIGGAHNRWKKDKRPDDIYLPDWRIVGSPDELHNALSEAGVSDAAIETSLTAGYSLANKDRMEAAYKKENAESKAHAAEKRASKKETTRATIRLDEIESILDAIKNSRQDQKAKAKEEKAAKSPRKKKEPKEKKAGTPGRTGARKSAQERIDSLTAGNVLDVSKMNEDGTGVKSMKAPGPASKKFKAGELPVVSSDRDNLVRFVTALGSGNESYIAEWDAAAGSKAGALKPLAVARATKAPSPAKPAVAKSMVAPKAPTTKIGTLGKVTTTLTRTKSPGK